MKRFIVLAVLALWSVGCINAPIKPQRTPLEIREMQTRQFHTRDERLVMKAVLNVLQDEGFVVKNAVTDLGLITAVKEIDRAQNGNDIFFNSLFMGPDARWEKVETLEATANVSVLGPETKVRVSFQRKVIDNHGNVVNVEELDDPEFYQRFLNDVDHGVFIQQQGI